MYFLFYAKAFDDVMKFKNLKFWNLIFSRTKRAYEVKQKTFFLVWQILLFRILKQTSQNVKDTTFKEDVVNFDVQKQRTIGQGQMYTTLSRVSCYD